MCPGWKCLGQLQLTVWGIISKEQRKAVSGRKQPGWLPVAPRGAPEPKLQRDNVSMGWWESELSDPKDADDR